MPTNRELYFQAIKLDNPYINKNIIRSLLKKANSFVNDIDLTLFFDNEIKNIDVYQNCLSRVLSGEPYQYVLNEAVFLGDSFYVDKNVLIPRQETEQLVLETSSLINRVFDGKPINIADICTGSGIIGIELKKIFSNCNVTATDIDHNVLDIALNNANKHNANVKYMQGDFISPIIENGLKLDVLVCNPPYIENVNQIDKQVWEYEPHLALLATPSTFFYEKIFETYSLYMNEKFILAFEIDEDMEESLTKSINKYFDNVSFYFQKDIYNKTRFLFIIKDMKNDIKKASEILLNGGVVGFATETVMGLGVVYDNFDAYTLLNKVKERPEDKPYSLMIGDKEDISKYAYVSDKALKLINAFLPGPVTFLLPVKDTVPSWVTHNGPTIGIRVPDFKISHELLLEVNKPLLVPSANKSGQKPAMTSDEVKNIFKDEIQYVVEGDALGGLPSTIIDLTSDEIKIVRQGPITMDDINKVLGE